MQKADALIGACSNQQLQALKAIRTAHERVRISGWFMLDPDHPINLGGRGTIWDIHPATRLEVP